MCTSFWLINIVFSPQIYILKILSSLTHWWQSKKTKSNPEGVKEMGSGRKKMGPERNRQGGNERALSQGIQGIQHRSPPLLPINYPQKLFEPDARKTGMGGQIQRGSSVVVVWWGRERDRCKIEKAPEDGMATGGVWGCIVKTDERENEKK